MKRPEFSNMKLDRKLKKAALVLVILLILLILGEILSRISSAVTAIVTILIPFFLALVAAYILDPVTDWLEKFNLSRNLAILIQVFVLFLLFAGLGIIIIPTLVREIIQLINNMPDIVNGITEFFETRVNLTAAGDLIQKYSPALSGENLKTYIPGATDLVKGITDRIFSGFFGILRFTGNLLIFLAASFYFLRNFDKMKEYALKLIPRPKKAELFPVLKETDELLRGFFRGQFIVVTILAALNVIGLSIVGLNFAFAVGILAGYLNIIPYVGSAVGIVLALILAFVQFGDVIHLVYVAAVFVVVQTLDAYLITPRILGKKTGLSPVVIIFSLLFFGYIFGFFGLLLAIPLAVIIKVFLKYYIGKYKKTDYYSSAR